MMRCMTAIWPAGPPNESAATRSQTRIASANETPCAGSARAATAVESWDTVLPYLSRCRGCPVVGFALASAAPGVKGVVHGQPVLEHRVVIREVRRQPERQRK